MRMKRLGLLFGLLLGTTTMMFAQGAQNIKINEVMTNNTNNYLDEYGQRLPWIELVNNSFTTYNVRGMFITTDKAVLDKTMSVPDRMKLMSSIPNGFKDSEMGGKHHLLLFLNSKPEKGPHHLDVNIPQGQKIWIAIYDGNGKNLIDSVTVPAMQPNNSYARSKDGGEIWNVCNENRVTPNANNVTKQEVSKIETIKKDDPYGIWLALLSMSVVFACLLLLYFFMRLFTTVSHSVEKRKERSERFKTLIKIRYTSKKAIIMAKDGYHKKGIDKETYMAVIALALSEYAQDVHDLESGIITIKKKQSTWNAKKF